MRIDNLYKIENEGKGDIGHKTNLTGCSLLVFDIGTRLVNVGQ